MKKHTIIFKNKDGSTIELWSRDFNTSIKLISAFATGTLKYFSPLYHDVIEMTVTIK